MRVFGMGAQGCIGAWIAKELPDKSIDAAIYDLDATPWRSSLIAAEEEIRRMEVHIGAIEKTERTKSLARGLNLLSHL